MTTWRSAVSNCWVLLLGLKTQEKFIPYNLTEEHVVDLMPEATTIISHVINFMTQDQVAQCFLHRTIFLNQNTLIHVAVFFFNDVHSE